MKAAVVLSTLGFFLAVILWHDRFEAGASLHKLYPSHTSIGVAVAVLAIVQAGYSLFLSRPAINDPRRHYWNALHMVFGWAIVLLGELEAVHDTG